MTNSTQRRRQSERPTENPTSWTIGVCEGCDVQSGPHVKGCPHSRKKWFPVKLIRVIAQAELCGSCAGRGHVQVHTSGSHGPGMGWGSVTSQTCPACGGSGVPRAA